MARGRSRREPSLGTRPAKEPDAGWLGIGVSARDRAGGALASSLSRKGRAAEPPSIVRRAFGRRRARRRRSLLGRLVYGGLVLGLWAFIAVAGLVAYHAAQLPPIDQLRVPKRPPNIAILASDGSLIANRGETGGRTV